MFIAPNSIIYVLKDCPLDTDYMHTLSHTSKTAQANYFKSLRKHTFTKQTYARVNRGYLRLEKSADELYDCNYLMFQNTSYGDKWFYAFITSVEYVNNVTCEVRFEIDVMQTWYFDYEMGQCFVEREHVNDDTIGANLLPEPVEIGELKYSLGSDSGHLNKPCICVLANTKASGEQVTGGLVAGIYTGLAIWTADATKDGATAVNSRLNEFASWDELLENVVSVFMYDKNFMSSDEATITRPANYQITKDKHYSSLDGYVPKNKKLFTYPYNYLLVTTDANDKAELPYEYFSGSSCTFTMNGDATPNPQVNLIPTQYNGKRYARENGLVISNFPQCAFNIDAFKAWLAQMASGEAVNNLSNATQSAVMGGIAGGGYGAAAGALSSLGDSGIGMFYQGLTASVSPSIVHGTAGTSVSYATGTKDFFFYNAYMRADLAKRADDYFEVYGYNVSRLKKPNRTTRPHWNYVKCGYTNIVGSIPADDLKKIISIYQNGITFWKKGSEVGNYTLNNH